MPLVEGEKVAPDFRCALGAKVLEYKDICTRCRGTIERAIKDLEEWQRELTQTLLGPAVPNGQAPPVTSPPNYTPPKPHSR